MTVQTKALDYSQDDTTFEGYFAWDDAGAEPRPCVLVSHAWGGQGEFEQARARDLAELGYAAFCVDVYGKGVRGANPEENAALMQPFLDDRALLQSRLTTALDVASSAPNRLVSVPKNSS